MLLQLNIENFALIEKLSVDFQKGFNVLSGETGAGKSILIDAINFVLGGKFNKNLIRTGQDKTVVEAVFTLENTKTKDILNEYGIPFDDMVFISRESFQSGKTVAKVNGTSQLLSRVKSVGATLLDIHGQHENQNLLDNTKHIVYLDYFLGDSLKKDMDTYKDYYKKLKDVREKIFSLEGNEGQREKNLDYFKYQIEDINNINPKIGEDIDLEKQYSLLSNAEKIEKSLGLSYKILKEGDEETMSGIDALSLVIRELRSVEKHNENIKSVIENLVSAYYQIEESTDTIRDIKDSIVYDEQELNNINSRIYELSLCKKKYGTTIEEILKFRDELEKKYYELENSKVIIEKLKAEEEKIKKSLAVVSERIYNIRTKGSSELEKSVKNELDYVGLGKSIFKIDIQHTENFMENGSDKVQFTISTNPGQPLKPLEEIVSGGELSRIMLALKTVFLDKDEIPSVIFDEIDTGISGAIAQRVGEKMFLISTRHQVFCVTHLPQIAGIADNNYLISKRQTEDSTYTKVHKLSTEEVEKEVARMIGGSEVTKLTIDNAKEIIQMSAEKKKNIINQI